jgi:hypothetical protein
VTAVVTGSRAISSHGLSRGCRVAPRCAALDVIALLAPDPSLGIDVQCAAVAGCERPLL